MPGQEAAVQQRLDDLVAQRARAMAQRRMFLGLALGSVAGACAGGGAAHALHSAAAAAPDSSGDDFAAPSPGSRDPALAGLRELATGPLDRLIEKAPHLLSAADAFPPGDEQLWLGVARLAHVVIEERSRAPNLEGRLRLLARLPNTPPHIRAWVDLLEARRR